MVGKAEPQDEKRLQSRIDLDYRPSIDGITDGTRRGPHGLVATRIDATSGLHERGNAKR